jgi:hypothetical protein
MFIFVLRVVWFPFVNVIALQLLRLRRSQHFCLGPPIL